MAFVVATPLDGWLSQWTLPANYDSLRLVAAKLILQTHLHIGASGEDHKARRIAVDAVHDEGPAPSLRAQVNGERVFD